jgi:putative hemolysin
MLIGTVAACTTPSADPLSSSSPVVPPPLTPSASASPSTPTTGAAAAYCRQSGGTVQLRQPTFNTNNDETSWVDLGEPIETCRFQSGTGQASTRIYTDLVTLYSSRPTLAALAYLAKKPLPSAANPNANPASLGCAALGGTDQFGSSTNGGGLVTKTDPNDPVFSPCMFADGSFIEEWGIAYYAQNDIRGKDLKTVFRFNTNELPPVFSS